MHTFFKLNILLPFCLWGKMSYLGFRINKKKLGNSQLRFISYGRYLLVGQEVKRNLCQFGKVFTGLAQLRIVLVVIPIYG